MEERFDSDGDPDGKWVLAVTLLDTYHATLSDSASSITRTWTYVDKDSSSTVSLPVIAGTDSVVSDYTVELTGTSKKIYSINFENKLHSSISDHILA